MLSVGQGKIHSTGHVAGWGCDAVHLPGVAATDAPGPAVRDRSLRWPSRVSGLEKLPPAGKPAGPPLTLVKQMGPRAGPGDREWPWGYGREGLGVLGGGPGVQLEPGEPHRSRARLGFPPTLCPGASAPNQSFFFVSTICLFVFLCRTWWSPWVHQIRWISGGCLDPPASRLLNPKKNKADTRRKLASALDLRFCTRSLPPTGV